MRANCLQTRRLHRLQFSTGEFDFTCVCRQSRLARAVRECVSGAGCRVCFVGHATAADEHVAEARHVLELASRVALLRRKRAKSGSATRSSAGGSRIGEVCSLLCSTLLYSYTNKSCRS